jgi:nucleoside 2-deoxyribosyltransferase
MRVYVAGPLFAEAERAWLDSLAAELRSRGIECFVPHEAFSDAVPGSAVDIFTMDREGMRSCDVLLAWLDGPNVDDGTAAEIGIFAEWVARGEKRGIVGYCTDLRQLRRKSLAEHAGLNLFVAGAVMAHGELVWSREDAIATILRWKDASARGEG